MRFSFPGVLTAFCCGLSILQAYDQHLNMILGDVEESVTTVEIDDETYEEIVRVCLFSSLGLLVTLYHSWRLI